MSTIDYKCADCGKRLSEEERPCPNCGSKKRLINLELKEVVRLSEDLKGGASSLFDGLFKSLIFLYIFMFIIFIFCFSVFFIYNSSFRHERLIFASTGLLTFIAIFYSLLVSRMGEDITKSKEKMIASKLQELKNYYKEKIDNSKGLKKLQSNFDKINRELTKIIFVKQLLDMELILLLTVFSLTLSIIFSLFDRSILNITAFGFFTMGITFSMGLVLDWRIVRKLIKKDD